MDENRFKITKEEIVEFYREHAFLEFENMNLLLVRFLKQFFPLTKEKRKENDENENEKDESEEEEDEAWQARKEAYWKRNNITPLKLKAGEWQPKELSELFTRTFEESKKNTTEMLQQSLVYHTTNTFAPVVKDIQSQYFDKMSILLSEALPKSHVSLQKEMETQFQLFQSSMVAEVLKIISTTLKKQNLDEMVTTLTTNLSTNLTSMMTYYTSTESRITQRMSETDRRISEIKDLANNQYSMQTVLSTNVQEILKKFEKSSGRGNASEHMTYNILLSLYPSAQVDHVGNEQKETGDIILIRNGKPKLLIENKDHTSCNVPRSEVDKFIRDCEIQNCSGIMLAQNRGIANKQNFELQIHQGNVLLYCHEVGFDIQKIKIAIEIVEHFKMKMDEMFHLQNGEEGPTIIEKETLNEINGEYQNYAMQKITLLKMVKEFSDKMGHQIGELKFPTLEVFLQKKFAFSGNVKDAAGEGGETNRKCVFCGKTVPQNMKTHLRFCKENPDRQPKRSRGRTAAEEDEEQKKEEKHTETEA